MSYDVNYIGYVELDIAHTGLNRYAVNVAHASVGSSS